MTITERIRTIGEKVFLLFVAFCLVGVFSSVSLAEEGAMNQTTPETPPAGTPGSGPPEKDEHAGPAAGNGIERGADATKRGVHRAGEAAGNGIEQGADATKRGVHRAGEAAGKGIERGADATKRGVHRAGEAASEGIERGVDATKRGVERAGEATGKGLKKAGEAIEKTFNGKDEER